MLVVVGGIFALLALVVGTVVLGATGAVDLDSIGEGFGLIGRHGVGLIVRTLGIAGGIGLLSVVLGIPLGRVLMGRRHAWVWAIGLVPLWMPSYAIYGAMNLARAPDTLVGGWLIGYATSGEGRRWMTIWAGYGIGVVGMALWGSVIASVVLAGSGSERGGHQDMMDLEPAGVVRRARVWIGLHRAALLRAWGLTSLVMLGSGVPLHLAQLETWSIVVWRALSERGADEWGVVWVLGSPMVVVGLVGAWWVTRVLTGGRAVVGTGVEREVVSRRGRSGWLLDWLFAGVVWSCGVLVPMVVLAVSIDDWRVMGLFWSERGDAIGHSVWIGFVVGVIGAAHAMGVACLLGDWRRWVRWIGVMGVFGASVTALVPGVLVGASVAGVGWMNGGLGEVVGLLARVLVVSAVVGAMLAGRERGELMSQRWSMGGGVVEWWKAHGRGCVMASVGAGVLCGLLAVHEIEASVMITRAGVSTLSQGLLADLHYARLERLSAALLNLMGVALVVSIIGGGLIGWGNRKHAEH
jgi:ABC-type Fe3+ transport system permease subunit